MNLKMRAVLLIPFLLKEFVSTSFTTSKTADNYDITTDLNDTIVKIFQIVEPQNVAKLIDTFINIDPNNFTEHESTMEISFHDIRVTDVISNETRIQYDFSENIMKISNSEFIVNLSGFATFNDHNNSLYFESISNLGNISIRISKSANNNLMFDIKIPPRSALNIQLIVNATINSTVLNMLEDIIPSIFCENIKRNVRLARFLEQTYDILTKKKLISKHTDLPDNEYRYHYFIPSATFTLYTLKDIIFRGLSNFQWLCNTENPLTYNLIVKQVRGSINLRSGQYRSDFHFFIDTLTISIEQNRIIRVSAQMYSVHDFKANTTLSPLHSAAIIEQMEVTIALSIMPSLEFQRTMKPRPDSNAPETTKTLIQKITTTTPLQTEPTSDAVISSKRYSTRNNTVTTKLEGTTTQMPIKSTRHITTEVKTTRTVTQSATVRTPQSSTEPIEVKTTPTIRFRTTRTPHSWTDRTKVETTRRITKLVSKQTSQETTTTIDSSVAGTPDPLNYHLLFNDVTVKLISGNQSYPEKLECDLQNKLKFIHKIDAVQLGTKHKPGDKTAVNFLANISSINISVLKSNNSNDSDSCQFQIHVNQIINVEPSPLTSNKIHSGINYEIWKKINPIVKSLRNETEQIIRIMKPRVCSTLDVCSQSIKMVKNVFLQYIDNVLNKCSLRRSKMTLAKSTIIF